MKLIKTKTISIFFLLFFSFTNLFGAIDINNGSIDELIELDGIGKAKAASIIKYRDENLCFKSIDELANIQGISQRLVVKNKENITLGECKKVIVDENIFENSGFRNVLLDPVNITFVLIIIALAYVDLKNKKDLKSQIVSVGVLGTFVGIFIGLQGFDPKDIINSVNDILVGLKTAFFTSIVGMSVATILSIIEKLKDSPESKS